MNKPSISTSPRCANTGSSAGGCGRRFARGLAEHHRLHAAEDRGERDAERQQQDRRRPRLLAHRRGEDQELAREHAERRQAEDRERAEHQAPADGRGSA